MDEFSGTDDDRTRDQVMRAALDVSRAHLLITGLADWAPPQVKPHAQEALDTLERAMATLRDVSLRLELGHPIDPLGGCAS